MDFDDIQDPVMKRLLGAANKKPEEILKRTEAAWCERPGGLMRFMEIMWPVIEPSRPLIKGWHLWAITEHLEAVSKGEIKRLLINVCPGSSKSTVLNVMFPAWEWGPMGRPGLRYLCFSYSQHLTIRDNVRFRQLILSPEYQRLWGHVFQRSEDQFSLIKVMNNRAGWKLASSSGGVATGERGDRILCLPFRSRLLTDRGWFCIGEIVEKRLAVSVAGWNGTSVVWQRIEKFEVNPGSELIEVEHEHGTFRATAGHPVWIEGGGYIPIEALRPNQRILCNLRDGSASRSVSSKKTKERLLFRGLPTQRLREQGALYLRTMWRGVCWETCRAAAILFNALQGRMASFCAGPRWAAEPKDHCSVSDLWKTFPSSTISPSEGTSIGRVALLLDGLRGEKESWPWYSTSKDVAEEQSNRIRMSGMRFIISQAAFASKGEARRVLFKELRGLYQRTRQRTISSCLDQDIQRNNPISRWASLSSLWACSLNGWRWQAPRSPHRSRCKQPRSHESDITMRIMSPYKGARKQGHGDRQDGMAVSIVRNVKRTGVRPDRVYNIRVSPHHNYFADGVLVHNCDDLNNAAEVESKTIRDSTNNFFLEVLPTRLNSPSDSVIVNLQQRTHQLDVSGVILERGLDYEQLIIPMTFDCRKRYYTSIGWTDPRGIDPDTGNETDDRDGELMWPEMYPVETCAKLRHAMGDVAWSGQFEQSPVPRGGAIFELDYWQDWPGNMSPDEAAQWIVNGKIRFPEMEYVVAAVDTAFTEKQEADFSAMVVLGVFRDSGSRMAAPKMQRDEEDPIEFLRVTFDERPKVMLMYAWQKRLSLHGPPEHRPVGVTDKEWNSPAWRPERQKTWGLVEWVVDTCRRYRVDHLIIETQAQGHGLAQELRRLHGDYDWGVELKHTSGTRGKGNSKVDRAWSVQHLFSNGLIYAPCHPDTGLRPAFAQMVVDECALFPRAKHDDLTDATVNGLRHLRDAGILVRGEEHDADYAETLLSPIRQAALYDT